MALQKLTMPTDIQSVDEAEAMLETLVVQWNQLMDALASQQTGIPLFGTAQTGGLLSPQQKTDLLALLAAGGVAAASKLRLPSTQDLDIGAIADQEFLFRSGTSIISSPISGVAGSVWSSGDTVPNNATGKNQDFFLHEPTGDVYERIAGVWTAVANIRGPVGPQGVQGPVGAAGPVGPTGPQGNYGAQGPKGDTGNTGAQGPVGPAGPTGGTNVRGWIHARDTMDNTGVADTAAAFQAIIAGFGGQAGEIRFEVGNYRVATAMTVPERTMGRFDNEAKITVDGVVLRWLGGIDAPVTQIFNCINGGKVEFFEQVAWGNRAAFLPEVWPEWFGARGDGATFDDDALDRTADSVRGWPQTPLSTPSWAKGEIRLRPGAVYRTSRVWRPLEAGIALSIRGGGVDNTFIRYAGNQTTITVLDYPAANQVRISGVLPSNVLNRFLHMNGPDHRGTHQELIADLGGGVYQTRFNHGWTQNNQTARLLEIAIVDLSGVFAAQFQDFTVELENGHAIMSGIYYHRDSRRTLRGSSQGGFKSVNVRGTMYGRAGFAIGSFTQGEQNWQEDLATFWNCKAWGGYLTYESDSEKNWPAAGFRFGSGLFANPLNYTCHGCVSIGWRYGVISSATNVIWDGGTIQSNRWDIYINNGAQHYNQFGNFRSEGSGGLLLAESPQSVAFLTRLRNIEFRGEGFVKGPEGTYDLIRASMPGLLDIDGVRCSEVVSGSYVPYTEVGINAQGNGYVKVTGWNLTPNAWVGQGISMLDNGGSSWEYVGQEFEVLSNTSDTVVIKGNWLNANPTSLKTDWSTKTPDGVNRKVLLYNVAGIRVGAPSNMFVAIRNCQIVCNNKEQLMRLVPAQAPARWRWSNFQPLRLSLGIGANSVQETMIGQMISTYAEFGNASSPAMGLAELMVYQRARVRLDANFTLHLGGNIITGVTYAPLPQKDATVIVEATQDATGGRSITVSTIYPVKWAGGSQPAPAGPNQTEEYEFKFTGTQYLARRTAVYG